MKRVYLLITLIVLGLIVAATSGAENTADGVLGRKVTLCEVDFQPDSYTLSKRAKSKLDKIVKDLKQVDTELKSIRIEGFISKDDTASEPSRLSLHRALAVEDYLRIRHKIKFDRSLTGHVAIGEQGRVEIAVYENPWKTDARPTRISNKGEIDGSG